MNEIITDLARREAANARSRKWYANHQKLHLERTTRWRNTHKEIVAEARKKLYNADLVKSRKKRRDAYWKNPERARESAREYDRRYAKDHPQEYAERKRKWYKANPDRNRNYAHNRRARVRNVTGGHFTDAEFQELCDFYGNKCLMCGRTDLPLTADHVIPLGAPNSDEISNIQPLCKPCNSRKSIKTTDYRGDTFQSRTCNGG